jgi:hypothetical protein
MTLLALAVPAICLAQTPGQPRLVLDAPHYDFGRIAPDLTVTHRFKASNTGSAPLTLIKLSPSCGCTSTVVGKPVLAPGESTELEVTFNSAGARGLNRKTVSVESNDPVHPVQTLSFEANVLPAIITATDQLWFADLRREDRRKASLKLETGTGQPIRVSDVDLSPAPWLGVATRSQDKDLWVDFQLQARSLPPDKLSGTDTVTLHLENPQPSTVQLSVHWALLPPVTAKPRRVAWAEPAGKELQASVVLDQRENKPFRILSALTTNPLVRVASLPAKAAAQQRIQVLLSRAAKPGEYDEKVILTLDTPDHPQFEIRVLASLR